MHEILDDHFFEENPKQPKKEKRFYVLLGFFMIGSLLSTVASWLEVETIIYSGPIMSIIGIVFAVLASKANSKRGVFLGLMPIVISVIWFVIIERLGLSPNDAQFIVPFSLSIMTVFILWTGFDFFNKRKNSELFYTNSSS